MELRKFRQQEPELFRRIQNLPLRVRVGRSDASRSASTVTFIRSKTYTNVDDEHLRMIIGKMKPMMPAKEEATKQTELPATGVPLKSMSNDEIAKACAAMMAEWRKGGAGGEGRTSALTVWRASDNTVRCLVGKSCLFLFRKSNGLVAVNFDEERLVSFLLRNVNNSPASQRRNAFFHLNRGQPVFFKGFCNRWLFQVE